MEGQLNLKRVHLVALELNSATNILTLISTEMMQALRILYDIRLYPQMFSFCGSHHCQKGQGIK